MTKDSTTRRFVPVLSSQAGSCLTMENWIKIGITSVSYRLEDLIMKPGLAALQAMGDIHHYLAWQNEIVINASSLVMTPGGEYVIRNHYDGSLIRFTIETLVALIHTLKADKVLLPQGSANFYEQYWKELALRDTLYFYEKVAGHTNQYLTVEAQEAFSSFLNRLASADDNIYIQGDVTLSQLEQLSFRKNKWLESNKPANDAIGGMLYSEGKSFHLLDKQWRNDHQLIDQHCSCPTCLQQLTRAYLHHLLQQTPLLAQRYLIQHNVYYFQHSSFTTE